MEKRKDRTRRSKNYSVGRVSNEESTSNIDLLDSEILDSNENLAVHESSSEIGSDVTYTQPKALNSSAIHTPSQFSGKTKVLRSCLKARISSPTEQQPSGVEEIQTPKLRTSTISIVESQTITPITESENCTLALSQRQSLDEGCTTTSSSDSESSDYISDSDLELSDSSLSDVESSEENHSDSESVTESSTSVYTTSSDTSVEEESSDENAISEWRWKYKITVPVSTNFRRRNIDWQNNNHRRIQNNSPPRRRPNPWDRNVELRKQVAELLAAKKLREQKALIDKPVGPRPSRWQNFNNSWKRMVRPEEPPWKIVADGRKVVVSGFGFRRSNKVKDSQPSSPKVPPVDKSSLLYLNHANLFPDEFGNPPRPQRIPFTCKNIRIYFFIRWQRFKDFFSWGEDDEEGDD